MQELSVIKTEYLRRFWKTYAFWEKRMVDSEWRVLRLCGQ